MMIQDLEARSRTDGGPPATPYRILHLVSTFALKTDTKWLLQIARHLDRAKFRLEAACFCEGGVVQPQLESLGIRTHNLAVRSPGDARALFRAARLIETLGAQLVHTHLLRADLWGGLAARLTGTPVCVTTAYAIGEFRRATRRRCDAWLDAGLRLMPTHVLAVADAVRDDCVQRLGFDAAAVRVIRTGIDPPGAIDARQVAEVRRKFAPGAGDRLVVAVARLSYEKGVELLIDAAAEMRTRVPGLRVVVIGDGPLRAVLEERIRARDAGAVVRLAGFVADVWPVIAAADVCCLPSRMEGLPNALLEAMAIGKPVVAAAVGGVPEVAAHGQSGWLVEPGSPAALAAGLTHVLNDAALAERLARGAAETVAARFRACDVVAEYGRWYESLIQQPNGPGA